MPWEYIAEVSNLMALFGISFLWMGTCGLQAMHRAKPFPYVHEVDPHTGVVQVSNIASNTFF
jgi:hypothetical protein